jgi:chemotaxis signal transduction protein
MHDNSLAKDLAPVPNCKLRLLQVGSIRVGLFEDQITTIAEWSEPAPLPFAPDSVLGVVCIQGRMFTVLALAHLLGVNKADEPNESGRLSSRQFIVALRGDEQLALAVDGSQETIEVSPTAIRSAEESSLQLFLGTVSQAGQDVQVLDVKELFPFVIQGRERRRRRL